MWSLQVNKQALDKDPEIRRIMGTDFGQTPADRAELAVAAGGVAEIVGHEFPAPTAAALALLEAIQSPFVSDESDGTIGPLDVFRALYILHEREKAALPVLRINRQRAALDKLPAPSDPALAMVRADQQEKLSNEEARFDEAAVRFADTLGAFSPAEAAADLGFYLQLAGGFAMLPDSGEDKKKGTTTSTT
nr:MAG TPA: hypothetical protein [Caudoviricetes sp.]